MKYNNYANNFMNDNHVVNELSNYDVDINSISKL